MKNKVLILGSGGLGKQIYKDFNNYNFNVFLVNRKFIDVAIIEKSQFVAIKTNFKIKIVSEFPLMGYFYKKKYLILK